MNDIARWIKAGDRSVALGDWKQARLNFLRVVEIYEHPDALLHLSYLESKAGRYRVAQDYALRAFRAQPDTPAAGMRLLNRLRNFNQTWAIHEFIDRAPWLLDLDPKGLQAVAAQLSYIGRQEDALRILDRALSKHAANPAVLLARAQINTFLGRFEDAATDLDACLMYAPDMGAAWWTLSRLKKQTASSNHVSELRKRLKSSARQPTERAYLAYALHKELDDLGDIAGACEALTIGCKAKRSEIRYSDRESTQLFDLLTTTELPESPAENPDLGFTPVFIVGMFRSGTTLLEQLLGGNPHLVNAGELYDLPSSMRFATDYQCPTLIDSEMVKRTAQVDLRAIAQSYIQGVRWRVGDCTHLTDKLPPNFMNVGVICRAFPAAKILHMVRDPVETCFSNLRELFSGAGAYSYDQVELGRYYKRYQSLMEYWHQRFPGRILDVHYAELTLHTEEVMRAVASHCGLDFLPQMVDPRSNEQSVATASAVQVRSPVTARDTPKWEPYHRYLSPLIQALQQ